MKIELLEYPQEKDWLAVKERALVTVGKKAVTPPTEEWKHKILEARHSPIRRLFFSFYLEVPYWVSVHLVRHTHAQPYVKSQRNDRQNDYDRNAARQDEKVCMRWDMNAEELLAIANKRLCNQASKETREVMQEIVKQVIAVSPYMKEVLVPLCVYRNGKCDEMFNCKEVVEE
jgi:thymidylate synthase ThyX